MCTRRGALPQQLRGSWETPSAAVCSIFALTPSAAASVAVANDPAIEEQMRIGPTVLPGRGQIVWLYAGTVVVLHALALMAFVPWLFSWTGVILAIALLTIPAATGRQWTRSLLPMMAFATAACAACTVGGLLLYEHYLVRPDDLSRVNTAFFRINALISLGMFAIVAIDLLCL